MSECALISIMMHIDIGLLRERLPRNGNRVARASIL
jgi:hypothetical protein